MRKEGLAAKNEKQEKVTILVGNLRALCVLRGDHNHGTKKPRSRRPILAAQKTNLALFPCVVRSCMPNRCAPFQETLFGLLPVLQEFLAGDAPKVDGACFGIAGPVVDGKVKTPNLPWMLDTDELRRALKLESVTLSTISKPAPRYFHLGKRRVLHAQRRHHAPVREQALIAAGTGLGQAILYDDGHHFHPLASEGGHADFAPRNELEIELLRYLIERFQHVSYERVLSGPGLFNIYRFFKERRGLEEPKWLTERFAAADDPSAVVSKAALVGEAEICVKTLELFVAVYGAEAGNLALRAKSVCGLYIGGGIAPKILAKLKDGAFMRAFAGKGRYSDLLAAIPVQVVLNDQAALRGAAYLPLFSPVTERR